MKELDIFIEGVMNLCAPTNEFAKESKRYSWFNKRSLTEFLEQGI